MVGSPLLSPSDEGDVSLPLQTKSVSMFSVTSLTIEEEDRDSILTRSESAPHGGGLDDEEEDSIVDM